METSTIDEEKVLRAHAQKTKDRIFTIFAVGAVDRLGEASVMSRDLLRSFSPKRN